jgi:hypothetical protein
MHLAASRAKPKMRYMPKRHHDNERVSNYGIPKDCFLAISHCAS